jgi:hypothetical protein
MERKINMENNQTASPKAKEKDKLDKDHPFIEFLIENSVW